MVFGLAIIVLDGFSMVANHWSNNGMATIQRYGLEYQNEYTLVARTKMELCKTIDGEQRKTGE